jgi:hypothetical protein
LWDAVDSQTVLAARSPQLVQIRWDLEALLDRHPHARTVMSHLAILERALRRHGEQALPALPARLLDKACVQLEVLAGADASDGLTRLQTMILNELADKEQRALGMDGGNAQPFDAGSLEIEEVTESVFISADRFWRDTLPVQEQN